MKLYYNGTKIYYAVYDKDLFSFTHTTNIPLSEFSIDEISDANKKVCSDISKNINNVNEIGANKYYIQSNELYLTDNWKEYENINNN
jgi:hypothetical protein